MKKNLNIIIYILLGIIVLLLLWKVYPILKESIGEKEIEFTFKSESVEVKVGNNHSLEYEINSDIKIIWESENTEVAKVNNGVITGVGLGNTLIKGTITSNDKTITRSCYVTTYLGEKSQELKDISVEEGELFITKGDSYEIPINYDPVDGYITSIEYEVIDPNIVEYDGIIVAKNIGETSINITVNKTITKSIKVNVVSNNINPTFSKKLENVILKEESIELKPKETKKIEYEIEPKDALIESVEWESSNKEIVEVEEGLIEAKSSGEAIVKVRINNKIEKEIKVKVNVPVTGISIKTNPNIVMKVGEKTNIKASIEPSNATNKKIKYTSNGNVIVNENGEVTGISQGTGTITITSEDGKYQGIVTYTVNPAKGLVNGTGGIWGYTSAMDKIPAKMDTAFFQNLAANGKGTISGNTYTYKDALRTYTYDLSTSTLKSENVTSLMRIYYPPAVDLSSVNTYTFYGGDGEKNFGGYFSDIESDRSIIKSSGIIILVSTHNSYGPKSSIYATEFVKSIVNQKSGVTNTVGGYSASGSSAGEAAGTDTYNRLIIFNSKFSPSEKLKNKEIYIYSAISDDLASLTIDSINRMTSRDFSNVTIISNNGKIANNANYTSRYLVINPGNTSTWAHHSPRNITSAKVFSFACR